MITRGAIIAMLLASVLMSPARATIPVNIEVQQRAGYARLILATPERIDVATQLENDKLEITFPEEAKGDFSAPVAHMPSVFLAALHSDNTKTLTYSVRDGSHLHVSQSANVIAIDIVDANFDGTPPNVVSFRELGRTRANQFFANRNPSLKPTNAPPVLAHLIAVAPTASHDEPEINWNDLEKWRVRERSEGFAAVEAQLLDTDAMAANFDSKRDLAYFYYANGLELEALHVIESLPEDYRNGSLGLLEGIVGVKLGRWEAALEVLSKSAFEESPEAGVWRAIAKTKQGAFKQARAEFAALDAVTAPAGDAAVFFLFEKAETAVHFGKLDEAIEALNKLRPRVLTEIQMRRRAFLEALVMAKRGKTTRARQIFADLATAANDEIAARAEVETVQIDVGRGVISARDALAILDAANLAWWGGAGERERLQLMVTMYEKIGDVASAMKARRRLIEHFSASNDAELAIRQQRRALATLLESPNISPTEAATLFYENIEFAPPGEDGDVVIQQAANKLIELDLLEPAAELLRHQVFYRLRGAESANVAAKLAALSLEIGLPQDAVDVLEATQITRLPEYMREKRELIKARALIALGDNKRALQLIEEREDRAALLARAEIYEKNGDLHAASSAFLRWLSIDTATLDRKGVYVALRAASLLNELDDEKGLGKLFELVAGRFDDENAKALLAALTNDRAAIAPQAFMEAYRSFFKAETLQAGS